MFNYLKRLYLRIGIHTAPRGTLFHYFHAKVATMVYGKPSVRLKGKPAGLPERNKEFVVAFRISGGIGDHLLAARYIRDFLSVVGDVSFDIYSARPAATQWIFGGFPQFRRQYDERYIMQESTQRHYRASFWLLAFVDVLGKGASHNKIEMCYPKIMDICQSITRFNQKISLFIDMTPRLDGYLAEVALRHGWKRVDFIHGISGISYGGDELKLDAALPALDKFGLLRKGYVTIHNGYDVVEGYVGEAIQLSTKSYDRFGEVIEAIRKCAPDLKVVQLGSRTSTPIPGITVNLINQTTLPECAEILRHSMLHIDGESGLVHMAACLGVKSCVVFGPTSVDFFAYPQNINIRPNFCGNCWWMTNDWLAHCPRGFDTPRCLSEQKPETIAAEIIKALQDQAAA